MDPDFDSEEEYGHEQSDDESDEIDESDNSDEKSAEEEEEMEDNYKSDPFLVRREAALVALAHKFTRRVIIFFNEKKQCARVNALFAVFGFKAVQVHGNMS